jgi:hypothetical protein
VNSAIRHLLGGVDASAALIVTNLRAEPHRLARDTDPELVNPLGLLRFD